MSNTEKNEELQNKVTDNIDITNSSNNKSPREKKEITIVEGIVEEKCQ